MGLILTLLLFCNNEFKKAKSPNVVPKGFSIVFDCNLLNMLFADIAGVVDDDGTVPGPAVVVV